MRRLFPTILTLIILAGTLIFQQSFFTTETLDENAPQASELTRLKRYQKHVHPDSPKGRLLAEKIHKIERRQAGYVKPDSPDEFVRILNEMKTPDGMESPQYPLDYRIKALKKAHADQPGGFTENLPWIQRGPANVSGRARGLIVDPLDPSGDTWFVGSVGGGIWKTTNAGTDWIDLTPDFPSLAVSSIAICDSFPDIMYAGTGESMFSVDVINGVGLLKSTDHGETWEQLTSTTTDPRFNNTARIIVDPGNPDVVIAATTSGRFRQSTTNSSNIFKSTDGGNNWTDVYSETDIGSFGRVKRVLQVIATPGNFDVQYAGVDEKGVLKSTDAGDSWFFTNSGVTNTAGRFELAISTINTDKIFASAEGGSGTSNLYVSTDAGSSWTRTIESGGPSWLGNQGWYDNTIVVDPNNDNIVYVGGVRLWQITINANGQNRSTTQLSTGPVHVDHHNLVIINNSNGTFRILNANDGGIGVSANGSSNWSKPTRGMNTSQFYGVDKKPGASAYVGGMQDNGTWRSPDNTTADTDWFFQIGGDGYETSWHFNDPLKIIGGSQFNGIARSLDGGLSYSNATNGYSDSGPFITKIAKTNMMPDLLFITGSQGVWRSTNFGGFWSLTSIPSSTWGGVSSFMDIKISRANPNIVWAGSGMSASRKIHVSTDQGLSFTAVDNFPGAASGTISGMSTHPWQDSTAYVLFSFAQEPKVLRTTDLGQSWEDLSGFATDTVSTNGFPDVAIYDLLVMPHTPDTLWAGTEIGLFESTDNGASWHKAENGLPNVSIWAMTHVEEEVVLATHGRGIWSVEIPGLSGGQTFNPLITELFQGTDGDLTIGINLRSAYDSTKVTIDGENIFQLGATAITDTVIQHPISEEGSIEVQIASYKDGSEYTSVVKNIDVIVIVEPRTSYSTDLNTPNNDFTGDGFSILSPTGFSDNAIHSSHPYPDANTAVYTLTVPIIVKETNAFLAYDDVAIIEPGDAGSVFGDFDFWDFVIVEGSLDGSNWTPLADGYDARWDSDWLSAYNAFTPGNESMYRHHELNLLDTFNPGDVIFIRFRLFADAFVTGWGWAIDNIEVQERIGLVGIEDNDGMPKSFALSQNYPNPFNPATNISYQLPKTSKVTIRVYNVLGQEVRTLVSGQQLPGQHTIVWDGKTNNGITAASGIYLYRMAADGFVQQRKMMFIK